MKPWEWLYSFFKELRLENCIHNRLAWFIILSNQTFRSPVDRVNFIFLSSKALYTIEYRFMRRDKNSEHIAESDVPCSPLTSDAKPWQVITQPMYQHKSVWSGFLSPSSWNLGNSLSSCIDINWIFLYFVDRSFRSRLSPYSKNLASSADFWRTTANVSWDERTHSQRLWSFQRGASSQRRTTEQSPVLPGILLLYDRTSKNGQNRSGSSNTTSRSSKRSESYWRWSHSPTDR